MSSNTEKNVSSSASKGMVISTPILFNPRDRHFRTVRIISPSERKLATDGKFMNKR